jgi:hypothetical protein
MVEALNFSFYITLHSEWKVCVCVMVCLHHIRIALPSLYYSDID